MHPLPTGRRPINVYHMALRGLKLRVRMVSRRARHFVIHNVLHADDPPHRLALGVAIGIFVTFTPTVGAQMLLVVLLAWLLGANKAVGVPIVWLTNPATVVPFYYPSYLIGRILLGQPGVSLAWWQQLRHPPPGWLSSIQFYWSRMLDIAVPLWLGCLFVATGLAVVSYYAVYMAVSIYRLKRWGQLVPPTSVRQIAQP